MTSTRMPIASGCRQRELRIRKRSFDASHRDFVFQLGASSPEKKLRCVPSELHIPTRSFESGKEASKRRIGTPYSNSELRIRRGSFDASHRNSVFQLGASNPGKKLRCVPSELRIPTRSFESGREPSMRPTATPYANSQ